MVIGPHIGEALTRAHKIVQNRDDKHILHTSELSRKDRELLLNHGWLQEIIRGWYLLVQPDKRKGDSSVWYAAFWDFVSVYLTHFFGENYCLSAEQSLDVHLGITTIPTQIVVMALRGRGAPIKLPHNTSLYIYSQKGSLPNERVSKRGLQIMELPYAICKVSPSFFKQNPQDAEIALRAVRSADELLRVILQHNFILAAGRLVGAYRHIGENKMAQALTRGLATAHIKSHESNPFDHSTPLFLGERQCSPYAARIYAIWQTFRPQVLTHQLPSPGLSEDPQAYIDQLDTSYVQDAYHSLSIEGYQVSQELIERVVNAKWSPDTDMGDRGQKDALAARGYYEAFLAVEQSLRKIFSGQLSGQVIQDDVQGWYRALFRPCTAAKIIEPAELYGYRHHQVYIRNSRHTPFPANVLNEAMDAFFQCLKDEEEAWVRAVLGHFVFVYIHPYMDGNGRIGRFLMNAMFGSGGYPWTIIQQENRELYLNALEAASCDSNIVPFVKFVCQEMRS